jgi:hypothetical protein
MFAAAVRLRALTNGSFWQNTAVRRSRSEACYLLGNIGPPLRNTGRIKFANLLPIAGKLSTRLYHHRALSPLGVAFHNLEQEWRARPDSNLGLRE